MSWDLALEFLGFTVGLVYLWFEYHANPRMWIASVVMPMISMWIYWRKGLYADFGINIYYLAIAVYGYAVWTSRRGAGPSATRSEPRPITRMPAWAWGGAGAAFVLIWWGLYMWLSRMTDSNVPLYDSFTTALSIVALWMLARKYVEQWLAWLVVDAVCVGLYIYKGIYLYASLYTVYTVIAWLGYRKWRRMMAAPGASPAQKEN